MSDKINHPDHYAKGRKYEPIDVIEDWQLGFCLGNCVKYISRAGRKDNTLEDLEKAKWYLDREISRIKDNKITFVTDKEGFSDVLSWVNSDIDIVKDIPINEVGINNPPYPFGCGPASFAISQEKEIMPSEEGKSKSKTRKYPADKRILS